MGLRRRSQGKVSKSEEHKIMNELLGLRKPWARVTSLHCFSREAGAKLSSAAFVQQCVGLTQDEWGLWCLHGLVSSLACVLVFEPCVLAFGCVYINIVQKRGVAGNYKCRHLLASLSPVGHHTLWRLDA